MRFQLFFMVLAIPYMILAQKKQLNIIPEPVSIHEKNGHFKLTAKQTIGYNSEIAKNVASQFASKIAQSTGFKIIPKSSTNANIQFNITVNRDTLVGNEGYNLLVSENKIIITANTHAGLFYGVQSLLQLLPNEIETSSTVNNEWNIPAVNITDFPRFGWRGIMLDVSRHFFTKEEVKTFIDQISRYKYNVFHWHLTDDQGWRIEIKSLPKLTEIGAWRVERFGHFGSREKTKTGEIATVGGYYSHEDIKDVVAFAAERNVRIIPEIDVPGHSMAALAAYPELSCTMDTNIRVDPGTKFAEWYNNGTFKMLVDNTLNPSDEKVYTFLDKVFSEVALLFPDPYIHAGGDECYKGYWKNNVGCQQLMEKMKYKHLEDLQGYFMARVDQILKSKGKKLLGWDEILEGGLSPDATVMSWRGTKGGIEAAKQGHNVVMSPTTYAYLDYYQGEKTIEPPIYEGLRAKKSYSFEPVPNGIDPKYVLGGQGNLWTEQISTLRHAQYMMYPRAWALSEVYWSTKESKNWDKFVQKIETHFQRAALAEINYSSAIYDPIITSRKENKSLKITIETEANNLEIYYSLDDSMPDRYSKKYTKPFLLPNGPVTLRVLTFRDQKPLGHLITINKAELEKRAKNGN